jgi:hypothetical protein
MIKMIILLLILIIILLCMCKKKPIKSVFVSGYYHTGTRWIHKLIKENSEEHIIPAGWGTYISNENEEIRQSKHAELSDAILRDDSVIIIYMIKDFESWMKSFKHQQYEVILEDDVVLDPEDREVLHHGWPSGMNVYDLYCYVIETNVRRLRDSRSKYIICNLSYIQTDKGAKIINILKKAGLKMKKDFVPIEKHTKTNEAKLSEKEEYSQNREYEDIDISYYCKKENEYINNLPKLEYRI